MFAWNHDLRHVTDQGVGSQASVRQRGSVTSATFKIQRTRADGSTSRLRSNSNLTSASLAGEDVIHPVEPRACTAMLPPVMVRPVITTGKVFC